MLVPRCGSYLKSVPVLIVFGALGLSAHAQDVVPLIEAKDAGSGWTFNNGSEFPGATGTLSVDAESRRESRNSLKLVGDFTKGGGYVQAGRKIDGVDIRELLLWVRNPDSDRFTLRINDASGQTHQIVLKTTRGADWQQIVLPLERFFARRGDADAVTSIAKYESWGGAKDGAWHGPATAIYLLLANPRDGRERNVHTLWLSEVSILPRPTEVPGAEIKTSFALDEILEGTHDWRFTQGEEFPGAKGSFTVVKEEPAAGKTCLKLAGDFTGGGAYVAAVKSLKDLGAKDIPAVRLRVKSSSAESIGIQLVDGSGQTHQRKGVKITPDGKWHDLVITPTEIAGGEHWGGPNDGQWHGPLAQLALSISDTSDAKSRQPVVLLAEIRTDALLPVFVQPPAFKSDFEGTELAKSWSVTGGVAIDPRVAFKGSGGLLLSRSLENVQKPVSVASPAFAIAPGQWEISLACKSELHSPDSSYSGVVQLECLDSTGQVVDRITLADTFGLHDWQRISKRVDIPRGVTTARFQAQLNKTYGQFWIDELAASYLAPSPRKDDRITRVLFGTAQLGNLLFPDDPRRVSVSIETRKPLRDSQHILSYAVRDYWGAEQIRPATVTLDSSEKVGDRFQYQSSIDLENVPLETGRYYEVHAAIPQEGEEPFRSYTSLAILPETETRRFKPEEVPFTSRNWDNRLSEYIRLTDRLGVRVCGLWGGWESQPPYKAEAPGLDLCQKLGMGWLTNTPEPNEEYFRAGYGQWCDAFDFHIYEDSENVRRTIGEYSVLMKKYGHEKPIWSAELGLNSQGQTRHAVAAEVTKKFATFFAAGGVNASWFGLLYPDPEGKLHGSSGNSHNIFDCRFNRYCPRLDAIAYYNAVNAIAIKKFVDEKQYYQACSKAPTSDGFIVDFLCWGTTPILLCGLPGLYMTYIGEEPDPKTRIANRIGGLLKIVGGVVMIALSGGLTVAVSAVTKNLGGFTVAFGGLLIFGIVVVLYGGLTALTGRNFNAGRSREYDL